MLIIGSVTLLGWQNFKLSRRHRHCDRQHTAYDDIIFSCKQLSVESNDMPVNELNLLLFEDIV